MPWNILSRHGAFSCADQFIFFKWALYLKALTYFEQAKSILQCRSITVMYFKVVVLCECLVTFLAGKGFLTRIKALCCLNLFSHYEQALNFYPVWINSCFLILSLLSLVTMSIEQGCGFSPEWIKSCCFKCAFSENALSHFEQAYNFSAVWTKSCISKWIFNENAASHFKQTCGFFQV